MLQLRGGRWPAEWEPRGWSRDHSRAHHEPFTSYWQRLAHEFPNIDSRVLEQSIHAHWDYSPYFGFPLQDFRSEIEHLTTDVLISQVGQADCWREDTFDPNAAYDARSAGWISTNR